MDAYFVIAEADGVNLMHVGGFATIRGPAPSHADAIAHVAGKLPLVSRRYRQIMGPVPFQVARPVWNDARTIDLPTHVRHATVPSPDRESLRSLVADIMSEQLDRSRPLWELWIIDGLGPDEWVFLWKVHHCMMDGVSGTEFLGVLFDHSPDPTPLVADDWKPQPSQGSIGLLRDGVRDLAQGALDAAGSISQGLRKGPGPVARDMAQLLVDNARFNARMMQPSRAGLLNGRVGKLRSFDWTPIDFDDVTKIRRAFGGTVNHVVLSAVLTGYRELLLARNKPVDGRFLKLLIPVSLRERDATGQAMGDGTMATKATALVARLPLDIDDPVTRLAAVRSHVDKLRESGESVFINGFQDVGGLAPTVLLAAALRLSAMVPQRLVSTVVTNVPGPKETLYLMGQKIESIWPYAPMFPVGARTSVSVYSYNNLLHFGITGDRQSIPDVDLITSGIRRGIADLLAAIPETPRAAPSQSSRPSSTNGSTSGDRTPRPMARR